MLELMHHEPPTRRIDIPIVGADGKYVDNVRKHDVNDVAAVAITHSIAANKIPPDFVHPAMNLNVNDTVEQNCS
jgi:hypothetical protein